MAVETSTVTDTRCVCTHSIAVHGIKNDPGCSFCSCRRFERPSVAKNDIELSKYSSSAFEMLSQTAELKPIPKEALVSFVKDGHGRMFAPGAYLVRRGDKSHALHVVLNG